MPKDFLGMDIEHPPRLGEICLSMRTFTTKMVDALNLPKETLKYPIIAPGRTDKKIVRDQEPENNEKYRSHVGALNLHHQRCERNLQIATTTVMKQTNTTSTMG